MLIRRCLVDALMGEQIKKEIAIRNTFFLEQEYAGLAANLNRNPED